MITSATVEVLERYRGRRVVVTGGLGFLGLNAVERLVSGGALVRVMSLEMPGGFQHEFLKDVDVVIGDLRDFDAVCAAVEGAEIVLNLAARSGAESSNAAPVEDLDVNGLGHLNLLEGCRRSSVQPRVVFASSRLVYGSAASLPVREDAPLNPLSIYGIHKHLGEQYHRFYTRRYGLETVSLRVTNPYGPHQHAAHTYGIVNVFIRSALGGGDLNVFGDGSQERDFIHVDDVIRAFLLAGLARDCAGDVFNIGGGVPIPFCKMAETVGALAGSGTLKYLPWPPEAAASETGSFVADISAAAARLKWSPLIGFAEGIRATIQEYRKDL